MEAHGDAISIHRMSQDEFAMFYRADEASLEQIRVAAEPEHVQKHHEETPLCTETPPSLTMEAKPAHQEQAPSPLSQQEDLLIQYCRGDPTNGCNEMNLLKINYTTHMTPWSCPNHRSAKAKVSMEAEETCSYADVLSHPAPPEATMPHWSSLLSQPNSSEGNFLLEAKHASSYCTSQATTVRPQVHRAQVHLHQRPARHRLRLRHPNP